jgi:hypothetical protein
MALDSYVGLITAVGEFSQRSDMTTAKVDYFIDLAESYFNQNLRTHEMETTNGSFTYSSGAITNPSDFLGWKRLSVISNGQRYQLQPVAYEQNEMIDDGTTGIPRRYVVRGTSTLLRPTPDSSAYTIEGTYFQKVPALSGSVTTNWVLSNFPDAYLFGSLSMLEAYIHDDPRIPLWKQLFADAVSGIKKTDRDKGFGQVGVMTSEYPVY